MQDKICVITGGSRGLGSFMAQGFLEAGAKRVYITARKHEACVSAAEELSQYGDCVALPGDITTSEGLQNLVSELFSREQHIDVLVNNAGAGWGAPFGQFPEQGWDKTLNVNTKSPFFLIQALAPLLKANARADNTASVINIEISPAWSAMPLITLVMQYPKPASISSRAYCRPNSPKTTFA